MDISEDHANLTRRQLLERGALVGGAVLAAQSLGTVSAYAQTSPPPPDPTDPPDPPDPPEPTGSLPENFQLVVEFDGEAYGVKYQPGDGWTSLPRGGACTFDTPYGYRLTPGLQAALTTSGVVTTGMDPDGHLAYVLTLPDEVTFVEGRAKDDSCIGGPGTYRDPCGGHVEQLPDGTFAFAACD